MPLNSTVEIKNTFNVCFGVQKCTTNYQLNGANIPYGLNGCNGNDNRELSLFLQLYVNATIKYNYRSCSFSN